MPSSHPSATPTIDSYLAHLLVTMGLERHHRVLDQGRTDPNLFLQGWLAEHCYEIGTPVDGVRYDFVIRHTGAADGTLPDGCDWRQAIEVFPLDRDAEQAAGAGDPGDAGDAGDGQGPPVPAPAGVGIRLLAADRPRRADALAASQPEATPRDRHREEIERYRDVENVHDLPDIFHFWSHRYVRPKLEACELDSVDALFLEPMATRLAREPERTHEIASLGAGNCDFEVHLAELLTAQGLENFRFECLELNPYMLERGSKLAADRGLDERFTFTELDVEHWSPDRPLAACLANHSLHHFQPLEKLFDSIHDALVPGGSFITNDMIGRNGHMRWPEALEILEPIWDAMPERYKYNHQLSRHEPSFVNWDCSGEGNEGIRAQDILPLLMERFGFEVFVAFGNIIDVFVDRSFGHNFDPERAEDRQFILETAELDERAIGDGLVKPTHLLAVMTREPVATPRAYRHWTPEFCVRHPD